MAVADTVDWVFLNPGSHADVEVGEMISAEAGGLPIYRVMNLRGGRAWLRDLEDGSDRIAWLNTFYWKALPRPDHL